MRTALPMTSPPLALSVQKDLVARWRETGRALDAQRRSELAAQTVGESQRAAYDMLHLGGLMPDDPARMRTSGLVEMQRLFARWRDRGRR